MVRAGQQKQPLQTKETSAYKPRQLSLRRSSGVQAPQRTYRQSPPLFWWPALMGSCLQICEFGPSQMGPICSNGDTRSSVRCSKSSKTNQRLGITLVGVLVGCCEATRAATLSRSPIAPHPDHRHLCLFRPITKSKEASVLTSMRGTGELPLHSSIVSVES